MPSWLPPGLLSRVFRNARSLASLAGLVLCLGCSSGLLRKAEIEALNREWSGRQYVTRQDIRPPVLGLEDGEDVIFQKGTKVKVWLESAEDWVRVKAYPALETREQTRGRTIIYIFEEDMKKEDRNPEKVKALLQNTFDQLLREA